MSVPPSRQSPSAHAGADPAFLRLLAPHGAGARRRVVAVAPWSLTPPYLRMRRQRWRPPRPAELPRSR